MKSPWNNKQTVFISIIILFLLLLFAFISSDVIGEFKMDNVFSLEKEKKSLNYDLSEESKLEINER